MGWLASKEKRVCICTDSTIQDSIRQYSAVQVRTDEVIGNESTFGEKRLLILFGENATSKRNYT